MTLAQATGFLPPAEELQALTHQGLVTAGVQGVNQRMGVPTVLPPHHHSQINKNMLEKYIESRLFPKYKVYSNIH